jgi:hypothetical protein
VSILVKNVVLGAYRGAAKKGGDGGSYAKLNDDSNYRVLVLVPLGILWARG